MAARQDEGAAHLAGGVVGEVEKLNVEVQAGIDNGIGVPVLTQGFSGGDFVNGVVVIEGVRAYERMDNALDLGQAKDVSDGCIGP